MEALDGLPPAKVHCSVLAEEAIAAALLDYKKKHNIATDGEEGCTGCCGGCGSRDIHEQHNAREEEEED
jgi:nitrogen fixation NifU-like protein